MRHWWTVIVLGVAIAGRAEAADPEKPITIDLLLRNDARVPVLVLERSQDEVARIFAHAGLAVRWTETAPRLIIIIVAQVLGFDRAASPVMGAAIRRAHSSTVQVFFRQVQGFARTYRIDDGTMLAYVIAHEIGHVFLGGAHSPTGLMQAEWDHALVHDAGEGSLKFDNMQAARIRAVMIADGGN